nr:transposase, MuDR, MULE transposase domain protein [Tanacetum cinerariifolium]
MAPSGSDALYFDVHHLYHTLMFTMMEKTNNQGFTALYFCLPKCNLEVGLKIIERDSDVAAMYDFVDSYGKLDMFMSHIHQNLAEIYFQNLDMQESEDAQMQTPKKKVVTPKIKVVEHVVDDVEVPFMNLVEGPKLKRKLLSRNSPSLIAKRKLMGRPRKTPLAGSSLVDDDIETPVVDEQVRVEEQASKFNVRRSSQFDVEVQEQVTNFDVGGSSDVGGCS